MSYVYYDCIYGYIPNRSYGSSTPPDLTQMVRLGEGQLPILCGTKTVITGEYTYTDFQNYMESVFDGFVMVNPFPSTYSTYYEKYIHFWFPNYNNLFGALINVYSTLTNNDTIIVIIPKMHRILCTQKNANLVSGAGLWEYNNGVVGNKIIMSINYSPFAEVFATGQTVSFGVSSGSTITDFLNPSNWGYTYSIGVNTDSYYTTRSLSSTSRTIGQTTLTALFGDAEDPEHYTPPTPSGDDPYAPGGMSETGGGTGDFDNTGDDIDFPALPSLGATDTGFISLFNPTLQELKDLASYMWSSSFDVALYKKLFADPMDCILGLSIVPVSVPDAGRGYISVGNLVTPVWMNRAGAQYIEVDCGSINVNEYWGSYLDYGPYTKAEIYLPYCGIHPISIDDIMGKTVAVKYHVDILSGACCAYVKCGNAVLYTFIGQCASSIPITGSDWTNVINGILTAAVSVGTMVATGGFTAPMGISAMASMMVSGIKPSIEKSGAMGGTGGMLAIQSPYLILTRPRQALPSQQNAYLGYPSFITANLGSLSGYTEIENVHLHDIPATSEELSEIENLLKSGVIL